MQRKPRTWMFLTYDCLVRAALAWVCVMSSFSEPAASCTLFLHLDRLCGFHSRSTCGSLISGNQLTARFCTCTSFAITTRCAHVVTRPSQGCLETATLPGVLSHLTFLHQNFQEHRAFGNRNHFPRRCHCVCASTHHHSDAW